MAYNTNPGKQSFIASTSQTEFDFNFAIFKDTDIKVYQTLEGNNPNDTNDLLILTTDYTVTITGDTGGKITLVTGAGINDSIVLLRSLPTTRDIEYQTSGDLLASTLNIDQDYQTYLIADANLIDNRALTLSETDVNVSNILPATVAKGFLRLNDTGTGFVFTASTENADLLTVNTISDLKNIDVTVYTNADVLGYYAKGDGGGGSFYWDSLSTVTDNGGTIIQATGITTGRWKRLYSGQVSAKWFGAKGDGVTNDTTSIQAAIDSEASHVFFPAGTYKVQDAYSFGVINNLKLTGEDSAIRMDNHKQSTGFTSTIFLGDNNIIDGLKFISSAAIPVVTTSSYTMMILILGKENLVTNCYIEGAEQDSILLSSGVGSIYDGLYDCKDNIISNNETQRFGRIGIVGTDCGNVKILNNTVYNDVIMSGASNNLANGGIWFERDVSSQTITEILIDGNTIRDVRVPLALSSSEVGNITGVIANNIVDTQVASGTGTGTNTRQFVFGRGADVNVHGNTFLGVITDSIVDWNGGQLSIKDNSIDLSFSDTGTYNIFKVINASLYSEGNTIRVSSVQSLTQKQFNFTVNDGANYSLSILDDYFNTKTNSFIETLTSGTVTYYGIVGNSYYIAGGQDRSLVVRGATEGARSFYRMGNLVIESYNTGNKIIRISTENQAKNLIEFTLHGSGNYEFFMPNLISDAVLSVGSMTSGAIYLETATGNIKKKP